MKHGETILVVLGLLITGGMLGFLLSDYKSCTLSEYSATDVIQSTTGIITCLIAYWAFRNWRRQLLYPRYIEAMNSLNDAFFNTIKGVERFVYMPKEDLESLVNNDFDTYAANGLGYATLMIKHELLIKHFALKETYEFMMWTEVSDNISKYTGRIYHARMENAPHKAHDEYIKLLKYCTEYQKWHHASLP